MTLLDELWWRMMDLVMLMHVHLVSVKRDWYVMVVEEISFMFPKRG